VAGKSILIERNDHLAIDAGQDLQDLIGQQLWLLYAGWWMRGTVHCSQCGYELHAVVGIIPLRADLVVCIGDLPPTRRSA
jgi:hypothetical protein